MVVVTQTDRPKSARNRRVIEVFGGFFCVVNVFVFYFLVHVQGLLS